MLLHVNNILMWTLLLFLQEAIAVTHVCKVLMNQEYNSKATEYIGNAVYIAMIIHACIIHGFYFSVHGKSGKRSFEWFLPQFQEMLVRVIFATCRH